MHRLDMSESTVYAYLNMCMYGTLYCVSINIAYMYVVGAAVYRTVENEKCCRPKRFHAWSLLLQLTVCLMVHTLHSTSAY